MKKNKVKSYSKYVEEKAPKSKILRNFGIAFFIGGLICVFAQLLTALYMRIGLDKETAGTCSMISMVFLGALLTGIGIYDNLSKHAGAGANVPITGFSNAIVSSAMEFKSEGFIMGLGAKMFTIAGPVLVFGIIASTVIGLVHWFLIR